jgi:hypothetical protein
LDQEVVFSNQWLSLPTAAAIIENYTLLALLATSGGSTSAGLLNIDSTPTDNPEIRIGGLGVRAYWAGAYVITNSVDTSTMKLIALEHTPGIKAELFVDGASLTSGTRAGTLSPIREFTLGRYLRISVNRNGALKELIVFPTSTTNRQKAEGYIAHKWGRSATLPVGHPYKVAPP